MANITIKQLEERIFELEEIVLVVRGKTTQPVGDYAYERKAAGNQSVTDWIEGRLKKSIGDLEFQIISGDYTQPHGRTKLETLRASYDR